MRAIDLEKLDVESAKKREKLENLTSDFKFICTEDEQQAILEYFLAPRSIGGLSDRVLLKLGRLTAHKLLKIHGFDLHGRYVLVANESVIGKSV